MEANNDKIKGYAGEVLAKKATKIDITMIMSARQLANAKGAFVAYKFKELYEQECTSAALENRKPKAPSVIMQEMVDSGQYGYESRQGIRKAIVKHMPDNVNLR